MEYYNFFICFFGTEREIERMCWIDWICSCVCMRGWWWDSTGVHFTDRKSVLCQIQTIDRFKKIVLGVEFERSLCYVTVKERNREIITLGCVCELTRQRERERERGSKTVLRRKMSVYSLDSSRGLSQYLSDSGQGRCHELTQEPNTFIRHRKEVRMLL